jgi:hypothetical protein
VSGNLIPETCKECLEIGTSFLTDGNSIKQKYADMARQKFMERCLSRYTLPYVRGHIRPPFPWVIIPTNTKARERICGILRIAYVKTKPVLCKIKTLKWTPKSRPKIAQKEVKKSPVLSPAG